MKKFLVKHLLYPLHELVKGQETLAAYKRVVERPWWPLERLQEFQLDCLKRLVAHAYQKTSFYKERFDAHGVSPADLKELQDFLRFPFVTKDDIRTHRDEMVAFRGAERKSLVPFTTGGSSGEPVKFYVDRGRIASEWAACWRARSWWGLDWGDRWFWLWGSPIELTSKDRIKATVKRVRNELLNRRLLSAFDMSDSAMSRYVDLIRREQPKYIYAYASAAYLLADFILRNKIDLSGSAPRVVFTTADTLYPHMREAIIRAFHCPVSIEYGSRDGGFIAHECPEQKLHIHADRVLMEIVHGERRAPMGEMGEIVLTNLDAFGMPFLRYRTGDVGALDPDPCPCGRGLPVMKSIVGWSGDYLLTRKHRLIHGASVTGILDEVDGIAGYRVHQEDLDSLSLEIVRIHPRIELPVVRIRDEIRRLFGYPISVHVSLVESLPPTPSGKHRMVISKLTGRYFEMVPSPRVDERSS